MRNLIRLFGLIAIIAVIGFSFAACGDAEQGPMGPQGEKGDPGLDGGMIPYIPAESGLLGTLWTDSSTPVVLNISDDGYTFTRISSGSSTYQLLSYWKGSDGTGTIHLIYSGSSSSIARIGISGNTLTWGNSTLTKQDVTILPSIPAESGLRGTKWIENDPDPYIVTFSGDGSTFDRTWNTSTTTYTVSRYWKQADGTHVVIATNTSGSSTYTALWTSSAYTKEE